MWQHVLFGLDPNQLIDTSIYRVVSAPNAADVTFPSFGAPQQVPPNEGYIFHGLIVYQTNGAVTARKLDLQVFGPVAADGVTLESAITAAAEVMILRRPLFLPPGFYITAFRNGADAGSTIAMTIWWQRVSLPAKRSLDKTRSPSPRRLDEIFMLAEG